MISRAHATASAVRTPLGWGRVQKFEVLRSVVVLDAVEIMHVFSGQEMPAEHLLHDKNVLEDVASVATDLGCSGAQTMT
jgi:hypothetical protein